MNKNFVNYVIVFLFMLTVCNLAAQADTLWTYEDLSTGSLWGVDTDNDNNIIIGGSDDNNLNISKLTTDGILIWDQSHPGYYAGGDLKIDDDGNIWTVASPDNMLLKLDSEGNVITTINVSQTSTFTSHMCITPDGDILTASSNMSSGWQITKISSDCEIIWSQEYIPGPGGGYYIPRGITADSEGDITVVGETDFGGNNCVVLKLDSDGNQIWQTQPINHSGSVQDVISDAENNIFITGANLLGTSRYIVKLDPDGEVIWTSESNEIGTCFAIGLTSNGTILTAGDTNQGGWEGDLRLSANDSDGNELWSHIMDLSLYEYYTAMKIDSDNNVICTGNKDIEGTGYGFVAKYSLGEVILEVPQDVVVDSATGTISWNVPTSGTPTGYNVYLDSQSLETITELTYTYQNLISGQSYLAGVSAVYTEGESEIVELEFVFSPILPPTNLVVDSATGTISWNVPVTGTPTGYNVYLDDIQLETVTDLSYSYQNLTSGQSYLAGVSAVYSEGESEVVELEFVYSPILPPTNLVVVSNPDEDFATFTWDEPAVEDLTGYNVYLDQQFEGNTDDTQWVFNDLTNGQIYFAGIEAVYDNGNSIIVEIEFTYDGTGIDGELLAVSTLLGNYPNPFNPETTISFSAVESSQHIEISIYSVKGQLIKTLINEILPAGHHTVVWNGTDEKNKLVSSGVYFYKMKTGNLQYARKMILMK